MILSYVEAMIPSVGIPGVKLGLANILAVFALYAIDAKHAAMVSIVRVCLSALLFGSVMSLIYSLTGAVFSLAVMIFLKKTGKFSEIGVSVAGAVFHNAGQICAAILILGTSEIAYYFSVLTLSGVISGAVIGLLGGILIKRLGAMLP